MDRQQALDLLHNNLKAENLRKHCLATEAIMRALAERLEEPVDLWGIAGHNAEALGVERKSTFDFALTCAESITGLVIATALVYPDKRLASVKPKSILKRMKKKDFARRVNRDQIRLCEEIGVPLADFAELSLRAMQGISEELSL